MDENPDFRLGQLLMTIIKPEEPNPKKNYMEDDEILKRIEEKITEIRKIKKHIITPTTTDLGNRLNEKIVLYLVD